MNYDKLVKALRHCVSDEKGVTKCAGCPYYPDITGCMDRLHTDAAAAIEALQAQLPKRGKWLIHSTGGSMATKKCPFCGSESWQSKEYAKVPKYCENCGAHLPTFDIVDWIHYLHAKTEVQE